MSHRAELRIITAFILSVLVIVFASACNLTGAPAEQPELTEIITNTAPPTRTVPPLAAFPTALPITPLVVPTLRPGQLPPTSVVVVPPAAIPTSTPLPISIVMLSPIPGNIVAGNVQVIGAAIHPGFLQYQVEFGPDPNPGNLWYPATGVVRTPVINGLLGIWSTGNLNDGTYQLRLRVFLRDGTDLSTVVNNIRVQNRIPTPVPTPTTIPRPIAAYSQDRTVGDAPLVVRFTNQSSGNITAYGWNFGDGGTSNELNPVHTFRTPGLFTVTLTVAGPGGSSNVSRQIRVQSPTAPIAAFTQDKTSGPSPLAVQFTDQSTGNITAYSWNFGDGTTSTERHPLHTFTSVGTYNVILTVTGPGGSSSVVRQITVQNPSVPPPVAAFTPTSTQGNVPLTVQFVNQSTGQIEDYIWDFGDGQSSIDVNPVHTYAQPGVYTVRLTVVGPGGQDAEQTTITANRPPDAPTAAFSANPRQGDAPLTVQFTNQSTGVINSYQWNFGDGQTSANQSPSHTFASPGTYTVVLTVTGPGGQDSAETTVTATAPVRPPTADFTQDRTEGPAPLTVQFINLSSGDNVSHAWNFGDGGTSTAINPSHTFDSAGTYTVTLTVRNTAGEDSAQTTITVREPIAPPEAAFSANPTQGDAPLAVQFTNQSTGNITAYAWDFGDGGTSAEQNPSHTFTAPGNYVVALTVSGPGGTDNAQATVSVNPSAQPPRAAFTANPTEGDAPLIVQFTDQSSGDITSYAWDFGDRGTSADPNPAHTFNTPGTYTVTLTVSGPGGTNTAQGTITVTEPAQPPTASFTANPTGGDAPLTVQFNSLSSGDITSHTWDFGDGGTSTEPNPAHTFNDPGNYTVTLTVSGPGGSSSAQGTIAVTEAQPPTATATSTSAPTSTATATSTSVPTDTPVIPPTASFSASPTSGDPPLTVQFTDTSTGNITSFAWDFGDGGTSAEQNPSHTFTDPGTYTVTLTVAGPGGESSAQADIVVSQLAPPTASFTASPTSGDPPLTVQFTNTSTGDITSLAWDFGDGGTSAEQNPFHTFTDPGTYTVMLAVSGPGGESAAQADIVVSQLPPPTASFTANPTEGTAPLTVQFTDASTGDITSYTWDFGDGGTSTEQNPSHTFTDPGTYTVTLTATGPGGESSAEGTITVSAPAQPPAAGFTANPTQGDAPLSVQFTNTSTGDITDVAWDFGDGGTSTEQNPFHTFTDPGSYLVTLTVSGPGGSNSAQAPITVNAPAQPPTAGFSADPTEGTAPLTVQFTDTSTGDITSYTWDFGDGGTSAEQNPSHTYNNPGGYLVTLTVSGPGGSNSAQGTITVNAPVQPPAASFTASPTSGDPPLAVQFTNTSTGDITSFAWDFGDGGTSTEQNPAHTFTDPGTYTVILTATGPGGESSAQADIVVSQLAPPTASFTANPTEGTAPLTVQFTDQSSGNITSYAWDFGDGGTSIEQNPSNTYATPGTYTATLTVNGPGGQSGAQATITVSASAQAPAASFTADPTSGDAPLNVQFTDTSTGDITSFAWDFGDGGTSTEQNPSYTYANPGAYTVTLSVSGPGGSNSAQAAITVTEAAVEPGIVETTPIVPDLTTQQVQNELRAIYESGISQGNRATVFAIAGDNTALFEGYLEPFAIGHPYTLDTSTEYLQPIIDWYNLVDLGGETSFNRTSFAAGAGWTVADLLDPANSDPAACNVGAGETPLECELRLTQPSVVIISIGLIDARDNTDLTEFSNSLEQVIQIATTRGVIPVLSTVPPRLDGVVSADQIRVINEAIIEVADANNVPVFNFWRALTDLPNSGLDADGARPSTSPSGAGDLTASAISTYGMNARNFHVLDILNELRNNIFPDATP